MAGRKREPGMVDEQVEEWMLPYWTRGIAPKVEGRVFWWLGRRRWGVKGKVKSRTESGLEAGGEAGREAG